MLNKNRRYIAVLLCVLVIGNTWCTGMVTVPPSEYDELETDDSNIWRVTTSEDSAYLASRIQITESDVVLQSPVMTSNGYSEVDQSGDLKQSDFPISIRRSEVVLIEKEVTEYLKPMLILGIPAGILLALVAVYAVAGPRGTS